MIIYNDTEKELTLSDYKPIKESLVKYSLNELQSLYDNISAACDNAYINHSDLLAIALEMDLKKIDLYIRMKQKKQEKQAQAMREWYQACIMSSDTKQA